MGNIGGGIKIVPATTLKELAPSPPMFRAPDVSAAYKHKYNFKTLPRLASSRNNSLEPDIGAGGDVLRTSKLSADALEFYPKSFFEKAQPTPSLHPTSSTPDYVGRHSQQGRLQKRYTSPPYTVYYQATPDEDCPPTYYNLSPAQQAAGDLIEVMHRVIISPGCFDDLVKPLIESLSSLLTDRETVETLADIIVEQSITEPNFRYNGARLCSFLNSKFHAGDEPSFRAILLNRSSGTSSSILIDFSKLLPQPRVSSPLLLRLVHPSCPWSSISSYTLLFVL
ncbi:unnamed protein product [Timema podura]|uniref:MIF4G domain-containing protein n=1 Tax=Timema podura TaxID=61482 RepID=A0ABN7P5T5_TIMPD|nr:unnamed protein product [Timema podura]